MSDRQLELAVLLPPWDMRYTVLVNVAPHATMMQLQAFAAEYQRCVHALDARVVV